MKYKLQIFLFAFLGFQFSVNTFCQRSIDKVLLLEYYEEVVNLKILKDYKEKERQFRYMTVQPIENPSYNGQRLDVDGIFDITDSSKVIFLGGGTAKDISIPFQYLKVSIEKLVNDSTVEVCLNNKKLLVKPGEIKLDSVISRITEGERIIQSTTMYSLKNYGLIDKNRVFDYNDREIKINQMLERIDSIE